MIYVGIDWAEAHNDVCILDAAGAVLAKRRIRDGMQADIVEGVVEDSRTGFSLTEGTVIVRVEEGLEEQAEDAIAEYDLLYPSFDGSNVEVSGVVPEEEARVIGGRKLLSPFGGLKCTTGFAVETTGGLDGISTAGHCPNTLEYGKRGIKFDQNDLMGTQESGNVDQQWWRVASHVYPPKIAKTKTEVISIDGTLTIGEITEGMTLCHSRRTQTSCGSVHEVRNDGNTDSNDNYSNNFVAVRKAGNQDALSASGDSGGPWFFGDFAVGIHHAGWHQSDYDYSDMSMVQYMQDAIGAHVKIDD